MRITINDLINFRYNRKRTEQHDLPREKERLKKIENYINDNFNDPMRKIIFERYINGDGLNDEGKRETWAQLAERLHYSVRQVTRLNKLFFDKLKDVHKRP